MSVRAAISFLSRIPAGRLDTEALSSALPWFPAAGAVVGLLLGVAGSLEIALLPSLAALLFVPTYFGVKGVLHTDGLADTADALASHGTPEEREHVLRDPHIGVAGAVAVAVFVLGVYVLFGSVERTAAPLGFVGIVLPALRWPPLVVPLLAEVGATLSMLAAFALAPLSPRSRLARSLEPGATRVGLGAGAVSGVALLLLLGGLLGLAIALTGLATAGLTAAIARRRFAGLSGDLLGAGHDLSFLLTLLVSVVWLGLR